MDAAAQAHSSWLNDQRSLDGYRKLTWACVRRLQLGGDAPLHSIFEQVRQARADLTEGFARKLGAMFVLRLQEAPWHADLMGASPGRTWLGL